MENQFWLPSPRAIRCGHIACFELGECGYQPPAVGPDLPRAVTAVDGSLWWRDGREFSRQRSCGPVHDQTSVAWSELAHRIAHGRPLDPGHAFPDGPFALHHEADAYEASGAAVRRTWAVA